MCNYLIIVDVLTEKSSNQRKASLLMFGKGQLARWMKVFFSFYFSLLFPLLDFIFVRISLILPWADVTIICLCIPAITMSITSICSIELIKYRHCHTMIGSFTYRRNDMYLWLTAWCTYRITWYVSMINCLVYISYNMIWMYNTFKPWSITVIIQAWDMHACWTTHIVRLSKS